MSCEVPDLFYLFVVVRIIDLDVDLDLDQDPDLGMDMDIDIDLGLDLNLDMDINVAIFLGHFCPRENGAMGQRISVRYSGSKLPDYGHGEAWTFVHKLYG